MKSSSTTLCHKHRLCSASKSQEEEKHQKLHLQQEERINALHEQLQRLDISVSDLKSALSSPESNDAIQFGKPALKTYRSYLKSRHTQEDIQTSALRTAHQMNVLIQKQKSQVAEWVRYGDVAKSDVAPRFPLKIILDNLRSAYNVGSIFRSADACHVSEVITCGITPRPGGSGWVKLRKSALGAESVVPTRHFDTVRQVVKTLKEEGCMLVGIETTSLSRRYWDVQYSREGGGTALFLGSEVTGVSTELMPLLDCIVEIPMFGVKNSLNVASCAPVVMFEIIRQWQEMDSEKQNIP